MVENRPPAPQTQEKIMEHTASEIKAMAPTYKRAKEIKAELTKWDDVNNRPANKKEFARFSAFREYTGNYNLNKGRNQGLGLVGFIEGYCNDRKHYPEGTSYWKPFGEFGSFTETDAGIYRRIINTSFAEPNGETSLYEIMMRGFGIEARKRGINVSGEDDVRRSELFFSWLAGTTKGIAEEKYVIKKLNASESARKGGWRYHRAGPEWESKEVDVIGVNGDRRFLISIKTEDAFHESCIAAYREMERGRHPQAYVNERLECRKPDNPKVVTQIR